MGITEYFGWEGLGHGRLNMCNKCNDFKRTYSNYNYCPICGSKLKECIFVPGCRLSGVKNKTDKNNKFVSNYI